MRAHFEALDEGVLEAPLKSTGFFWPWSTVNRNVAELTQNAVLDFVLMVGCYPHKNWMQNRTQTILGTAQKGILNTFNVILYFEAKDNLRHNGLVP